MLGLIVKRRLFNTTTTKMTKLWMPQDNVPERVQKLLTPNQPTKVNYILSFIQIVRLLKTQKRTGWVDCKIPPHQVESISDHMYRMSIIAMCIPNSDKKINIDKCVKIAVIHDIAESLVGDITPFEGVPKSEKHRRELETMKYLSSIIEPYNKEFSEEIMELWLDYEEIRCLEARYVKDIDKLEMIQQAWDYEQDFGIKYDLNQFYESRSAIKTKEIQEICDELINQRNAFIEQKKEESS
ncbi:5'-deoxynucleotidase [[Candida] jaroonii]|uniref:5'-deoxynucleotidase n=1 Tax=[Candida] jaroonii TaxID=467808 RepID=A0ACA9Y441_9ASCO|nr:5'-deoxynucleotidase [[Candida] jaroonii]